MFTYAYVLPTKDPEIQKKDMTSVLRHCKQPSPERWGEGRGIAGWTGACGRCCVCGKNKVGRRVARAGLTEPEKTREARGSWRGLSRRM